MSFDTFYEKLADMSNPERLTGAMESACLMVERDAKRKCPVDTGTLRRSIESKVETSDTAVTGTISTPLDYGIYIEYGTGLFTDGGRLGGWSYRDNNGNWHHTDGIKPQPYLRPALIENRAAILNLL